MRGSPSSLMLFAAGRGTRMGALTNDRPKPMIPVAGRPLIDHALALVREAAIPNVVANVHYLPDQITEHLKDSGVLISDETDALLETGGGLRRALPLLRGGPVFTLNSDAVWTGTNPISRLLAEWRPDEMDGLLLLVERQNARGHVGAGDFHMDRDGRLCRGPGLVYTGAQILTTGLLAEIPEAAFSLNRVWDLMLDRRRLYGIVHRGGWCDVGSPEGIARAEAMLKAAGNV